MREKERERERKPKRERSTSFHDENMKKSYEKSGSWGKMWGIREKNTSQMREMKHLPANNLKLKPKVNFISFYYFLSQ